MKKNIVLVTMKRVTKVWRATCFLGKKYLNNAGKKKDSVSITDGVYKKYYRNGKIEVEGNYKAGKKAGLFKYYYENGNLEEEGYYKDCKAVGLYKWYNKNGNLVEERNNKNGIANGLCKEYYDNGKLWKKYRYTNGKISEGLYLVFYKNGMLWHRDNYKNDMKEGAFVEFYPKGKLKSITIFRKDRKKSNFSKKEMPTLKRIARKHKMSLKAIKEILNLQY